ncbi:MAG: phosphoenolpyruvate--protein phosphotransferase [Brevinema sp.]
MILLDEIISSSGHSSKVLLGTPISKGLVEGRVFFKKINRQQLRSDFFPFESCDAEISKYLKAVEQIQNELATLQTESKHLTATGRQMIDLSATLIRSHLFNKQIPDCILELKIPAQTAVQKSLSQVKSDFDKMENDYFRSRFDDFKALGNRIIDILNGNYSLEEFKHPAIFVAEEVTPTEIIRFSAAKKLLAVLSIHGGTTSHAAIVAEACGVPAIFDIKDLLTLKSGQRVIVDAYKGQIIVDPDAETRLTYRSIKKRRANYEKKLIDSISKRSQTLCGCNLDIFANVGVRDDITVAKQSHADGIGLLRTEVFMMTEKGASDEESLFKHYSSILAYTDLHPVTVRTLDLGGDKYAERTGEPPLKEANPFLGYRSTRMFLDDPTILKAQLRALLRASVKNPNIKIMFPFISTLEDVLQLRAIYDEIVMDLLPEIPHIANIPVGIMAEVPSIVLCLEDIFPFVDFVSLGTNDLTQYTLAVDRNNPYVSRYYQNIHPSLIKLIQLTVDKCNAANIPVSICGEMSKEPYLTRLLLGMGLRTLSLNPSSIPLVKFTAMSSRLVDCEEIAKKVLVMKTSQEIMNYLDADLSAFLKQHDAHFDYEDIKEKK